MGFSDAFTKNASAGALEFSDPAFTYFSLTVILVLAMIFSVMSYISVKSSKVVYEPVCSCSKCTQRSRTPIGSYFGRNSYLLLGTTVVLWAMLIYIGRGTFYDLESTSGFDPYAILGIQEGATAREIKKRYRELALLVHPDRDKSNAAASAKFQQLVKAHHTLTDKTAFENYTKYGNPDGPSVIMQISMALPSFLIDTKNQVVSLLVILLSILMIAPAVMFYLFDYVSESSAFGVDKNTVHYLADKLSENLKTPEIICLATGCYEIRNLQVSATPEELIELRSTAGIQEILYKFPCHASEIACYLIYCHLNRSVDKLKNKFARHVGYCIIELDKITLAMIQLAFVNNWAELVSSVVTVRKSMYQALGFGGSVFGQFPHFDYETSLECTKIIEGSPSKPVSFRHISELTKLITTDSAKFIPWASADQIKDIITMTDSIPKYELNVTVSVEDEDCIVAGDVVTIAVNINRINKVTNLGPGASVHAPNYPGVAKETLFVLVTDIVDRMMLVMDRVSGPNDSADLVFKLPASRPGTRRLSVVCLTDCFLGNDVEKVFSYTVENASPGRRTSNIHPEDAALDLNQSFFGVASM